MDVLVSQTSEADADGEIVWSWPPDAEAKLRDRAMTGAIKPGPRGDHV
jgi:hypothetical protein